MTITPTETTDKLSSLVAAEIRAVMGRNRVRQAHLARRLAVNDVWLSVRLTGKQAIDLNDLQRIAAGLDVSVLDLIGDAVRREPGVTRQLCTTAGPGRHVPRPGVGPAAATRRPADRRPAGHATRPDTGRTSRIY